MYSITKQQAHIWNHKSNKETRGEKEREVMRKQVVTYGELKCRKAELRSERAKGNYDRETTEEYRTVLQMIRRAESWLLWTIVSLMLCFAGCKAGVGVGLDTELFWPDIKTAKGGEFGDPTKSRENSTQRTIGMARNNLPMIGGEK